MRKLNWYYTVIAFVAALLIIGGGYTYWDKAFNKAPFKEALLEVEAVDEVEVINNGGDTDIVITASYHQNIKQMVNELEQVAEKKLDREYTLTVIDRPDQELTAFKEEICPALYEGVRRGNYREIEGYLLQKAEEYSFDHYRFAVDNRRIYVQAKSGQHYLYLLVPVEIPRERGSDLND